MDEQKLLREERIDSAEVFSGVLLHVFRDTVRLPNGNTSVRELIHHVGAVGIVAVTDDHRVVLERQFRYPMNRVITEIPAGKLDGPGEDRLEAAKRELREETGLTADCWTELGQCLSAAAYTDESLTLYLATGLHEGEQALDADEFLSVEYVPFAEALAGVMDGSIIDGKTQVGLLKTAKILGIG